MREKWTEVDGVLYGFGGKFDLRKLFPIWDSLLEVQKYLIVYGVKQRLSDSTAGQDNQDKPGIVDATWRRLLAGDISRKTGEGKVSVSKLTAAAAAAGIDAETLKKILEAAKK